MSEKIQTASHYLVMKSRLSSLLRQCCGSVERRSVLARSDLDPSLLPEGHLNSWSTPGVVVDLRAHDRAAMRERSMHPLPWEKVSVSEKWRCPKCGLPRRPTKLAICVLCYLAAKGITQV